MPENTTQNPGSSAAATTAASATVAPDAPRKSASKVKTAAAIMATSAALQTAAAQAAAPSPVQSPQELHEVSQAFLDGPPLTETKKAAQSTQEAAATTTDAASDATTTTETESPGADTEQDTTTTTEEIADPGDDHADAAFSQEAQAGPEWLQPILDKIREGKPVPKWATKRLAELADKAIEKNATAREKEARIAELEEAAAALHTTEVPAHDVRGPLARVTDTATLKQHQSTSQQWIDWAASVRPDETGTVPNPLEPQGEPWTLEQVHEALGNANVRNRAATAQLDYLQQFHPAHEEAKKAVPALFDRNSEEHKIAKRFLDANPWLESKGDKEAILARLVLGEQVLQKRAKGVHTVDVTTAKPAATTTKTTTAKPTAVTTAPVRSGNAPVDIKALRERKAAGDMTAQRQIDEAFLS